MRLSVGGLGWSRQTRLNILILRINIMVTAAQSDLIGIIEKRGIDDAATECIETLLGRSNATGLTKFFYFFELSNRIISRSYLLHFLFLKFCFP